MDDQNQDDEYFIPLQDQRVFGAGINRKRIQFVPSSSQLTSTQTSVSKSDTVGDFYLSLVLPKSNEGVEKPPVESRTLCEVCNLPIDFESDCNEATNETTVPDAKPHESSLAHQVCLSHSHPPSHLDRSRKGLQYLESYGWDPDSRKGLGKEGQGIRMPIKTEVKNDTLGIGLKRRDGGIKRKEEVKKLNAKEVRKMEEEGRKKRERLQEMFYGSDEMEKYLGKHR